MSAATAPTEHALYGEHVEQEFAALTTRPASDGPPHARAAHDAHAVHDAHAADPPYTDPPAHPLPAGTHSRTPSGSVASLIESEVNTDVTMPLSGAMSPIATHGGGGAGSASASTSSSAAAHERPSFLDASALSPDEFATYHAWVERIKPAHSRRRGLLDEHSAIKFLRSEFGINSEDEVQIMCLFERLPLGLLPGHFFAMVRLAAWAQQGSAPTRDLIFTQTTPPFTRRRRKSAGSAHGGEQSPALTTHSTPIAQPAAIPPASAPPSRQTSAARPRDQDKPRVVRPTPVVARRPSRTTARSAAPDEAQLPLPMLEVPTAPPPVVDDDMDLFRETNNQSPVRHTTLLDRPSAPLPPQQVSPLIQASLNARSEVKRASRQAVRPMTFTVLSSSSGQFDRAKARLLTGQEAPPEAQPAPGKRRTQSMTKTVSGPEDAPKFAEPHTVAPKPSYLRKESGTLPAWLREQEEGDKPPAYLEGPSVLETLSNKAEQMDAGEHAAASIDRNTPFFPPHKRDLERVAEEMRKGGLARYRALNAQTSETSRTTRLHGSRSKGTLSRRRSEMQQHQQPYGTTLESGTYAGFRPLTTRGDLRILASRKELHNKREFQHHFPPELPTERQESHDSNDADASSHTHDAQQANSPSPEPTHLRRPSVRLDMGGPRMQPAIPRPETQRFLLQEDVTRPQLPYVHTPDRDNYGPWGEYGKAMPQVLQSGIPGTLPVMSPPPALRSVSSPASAGAPRAPVTPGAPGAPVAPGAPGAPTAAPAAAPVPVLPGALESLAPPAALFPLPQSTPVDTSDTSETTIITHTDSSERLNQPLPPLPGT